MTKKKTAFPSKALPSKQPKSKDEKPATKLTFSIQDVGVAAGLIWQLLNEKGELKMAEIKSEIDGPADLVVAAVGWLAREEKLRIRNSGRSVIVSLH